ncbi:hypothetical protein [Dactylosporangium salmoneum]|uniref:Uncharacterized protein n=1 Tax=Dactylosporangium salmoneum TaxID=53361 RepID=A0ABN3G7Y3_9ACTN
MSDFDLDWGMEHDLHVDHDGGVDHVLAGDHLSDERYEHDYAEHEHDHGGADVHDHGAEDVHDLGDVGEDPHQHDEPLTLDEHEPDLPDWQLDTQFLDGHYDLVGADPGEHDLWSQFMTEMHEEINPYAAN